MLDYIIVGAGLAGIAFAETAIGNGKSIMVYDDTSQISSLVAGGLYNPVILKRFTQVWQANEQLALMHEFYQEVENKLQVKVNHQLPLYRKFYDTEEQNNWFAASDKPQLTPYLSTQLIGPKYASINAPLGFGEVLGCGYVDTAVLVAAYHQYLVSLHFFTVGSFDHTALQILDGAVHYKNIKTRHIIFAEGYGMHANPYFAGLPLDGAKGELLLIKAPALQLDAVIKTDVFILPLGDDLYKVGATYNWDDKTNVPTQTAREELLCSLKELINCEFEVLSQLAGIRPTVKDRRPLIGTHLVYPNLHLLNGLGTRGVMLAPAMAKALFEKIEYDTPLDSHIDLKRFKDFGASFYRNE